MLAQLLMLQASWIPAWKDAKPNIPGYTKNGSEYTHYWILPAMNWSSAQSTKTMKGRRLLHILALSSPESVDMLRCWTMWIQNMQMREQTNTEYLTHIYTTPSAPHAMPSGRGGANFGSKAYNQATSAKAAIIKRVLQSLPLGALILFTDLDVLPLRSFSALVDFMDKDASSFEIVFMWEYLRHMPVNTGFVLMRNTPAVQDLMREWHLRQVDDNAHFGAGSDQRWMNQLLLFEHTSNSKIAYCPSCNRSIRWGNFPQELVSAHHERLSPSLVAFHATGWTGHAAKMARLSKAINVMQNISNGSHWQRQCT